MKFKVSAIQETAVGMWEVGDGSGGICLKKRMMRGNLELKGRMRG